MKRFIFPMIVLLGAFLYTSCENYETYGDKKEKERNAISRYIAENNINVISETVFKAQGETTDTTANEYVRLDRNGVYMQIVRKGCGSKLEEDKVVNLLCRFLEYNILEDSVLLCNNRTYYLYNSTTGERIDTSAYVDKMSVTRTGTTISATFISGLMKMFHSSSSSVPSGWLVPLNYVNVGRPDNDKDEIAKVKLIVPHSQGTAEASASVYPCYYEITYVREK